ncbi:putative sulfate exporter family transporter [bacterium]|nr:MAG: putative sulfate exporter family transporter [bacterium]
MFAAHRAHNIPTAPTNFGNTFAFIQKRWRGVAISAGVGLVGVALGRLEGHLLGREWLEGLVIAIILGLVIRLFWTPNADEKVGIAFCAKPLLEVAIVLLGASLDAALLRTGGFTLLASVFALVVLSVIVGTLIGRAFGLPPHLATLVACGNSICGNSAIAAIAPVIEADEEHITAAVAFTALGSVVVVIALPFIGSALGLGPRAFGTLAGLSVYAVPQVLAATAGVGVVATQTATLVKLARVLMLGPLTLFFALRKTRQCGAKHRFDSHTLLEMLPPFIIGFALLGLARSLGWLSEDLALHGRDLASCLTVVAMAALGLSSDPRAVQKAGKPVVLAAGFSLLALVLMGYVLIRFLHI